MRGYFRIDLANNCNIRCIMCQAYNSMARADVSFISYEKFVQHTRGMLKDWGTIQLGNAAEPTIHPQFADFLRYVRSESDAVIHIVTNAKLLDRYADLIHEVGNCWVQVSMDSVEKKTHEYIREGSSYDRMMSNVNRLVVGKNKTRVLLSFTLMKSNVGEYEGMVAFCKERGYNMCAFPMIVRDEGSIIPKNLLTESLWFNLDALKTWLTTHYGKDYGGVAIGAAAGTTNLGIDEFSCNAHHDDLSMDAYGNVTLCGKVRAGNLQEQTLNELLLGEVAEEFRRQVDLDRGPCMTCDYRQRCMAPSMTLLANHFSERIFQAMTLETRQAIGYSRTLSDDEACNRFIADVASQFGIYDIAATGSGFKATRILASRGGTRQGQTLEAATRHELHQKMVDSTPLASIPHLIESFGTYNLVGYRDKFWALPLSQGELNLTTVAPADHSRLGILIADDLEELKTLAAAEIETQHALYQIMVGSSPLVSIPRLIESFGTYNLVAYLNKLWALPLSLGDLNLTTLPASDHSRLGILIADDLAELKKLTTAELEKQHELQKNMSESAPPASIPRLIESFGTYNLVGYQDKFWALPLSLGELNLATLPASDHSRLGIVITDDLAELKRLAAAEPPKLVESYGPYNLVSYRDRFWAVPRSLGHVDLTLANHRAQPGIIGSNDIDELKRLADGESDTGATAASRNFSLPVLN